MSDFGVRLAFVRCDGEDATQQDIQRVENALEGCAGREGLEDALGEAFSFALSIEELPGATPVGVMMTLTQYWAETFWAAGLGAPDVESIVAADLTAAQPLIDTLEATIGESYRIEIHASGW